jgi:CRISPR-associated endonuclease Cas2
MEKRFLFIYDIHLPKTMRNVAKLLKKLNATRIQKSVFEILGSEEEMRTFFRQLLMVVKEGKDKIALIPICEDDAKKTEMYGIISKRGEALPDYYLL